MPRRKRVERFHKQIVSYRYRDARTGAYVSPLTKRGKKRKNVTREKYLTLLTADKQTGEIRKYGSIREPSRQSLAKAESKGSNVFLKGFFRRAAVWEKAVKAGATGVLVTIRGKGKRNKDTAIRTKVIFDQRERRNPEYMQMVVLAKVMRMLAERELRLSDLQITSHKKYTQLSHVKIDVDYYSDGAGIDEDGGEDADGGNDEWPEEDNYTSGRKRKRKRNVKRKRKRRPKLSRSTRKTTRKGKFR